MQKEALLGLIKSRGGALELAGEQYIYIDDGISGTNELAERPAFARLIEDITLHPKDERPFDAVAVYKIDRFARKLRILLDVIDFFRKNEVQFMSANEMLDTSTPFGNAMLSIIGVIAELERETLLGRTRDGREQAVEAGVAMGANVPYGFDKDEFKRHKILDAEAETVRRIFSMFVNEARSTDYIARQLRTDEVLSPQASAIIHKKRKGEITRKNELYFWFPDSIRRMLQDEIYIGKIYSNKFSKGKLMPKEQWKLSGTRAPAIVDLLTFEKAQRLYAQSVHQKRVAKDGHIYLLSGLLRCDCCFDAEKDTDGRVRWAGERRELGKGTKHYTYYYKCVRKNKSKGTKWCPAVPLPADEIEQYIVKFSRKLLSNPIAVFNHQEKLKSRLSALKHLRKKEEEIVNLSNALPARKDRIREQHAGNYITMAKLKAEFKNLEEVEKRYNKELKDIRSQIAQSNVSQEYMRSLELFSKKYADTLDKSFADRKALYSVLHELIEEVVVFSRDVDASDPKIAGKKREGQKLPHKLHIKLKLPQDIISQLPNLSSGKEMIVGAG